jgi:hypothetical protein
VSLRLIIAPNLPSRHARRQPSHSILEARMIRCTSLLTLALALSLAGGCSRGTAQRSEQETIYQAESSLTIRVLNNSRLDATIYLIHDGARERMGTVTATSSGSFPLRARTFATGDFALVAEPVGSRRAVNSERLNTGQGSVFTWTLDTDLRRGSILVQ